MKKIRCARCSVVNLEGFVSFPNCVACGARLEIGAEEKLPLWQRPLRTAVWASLLGAAILISALVVANGLRHDYENKERIVVLTPRQTQVRAGDPFDMVLRIEALDVNQPQNEDALHGVRLRVATNTFQRFQLLKMEPQPDETFEVGRASYFSYQSLKRGSQITLTLRALRLGRQQFTARVYSDNQTLDNVNVDVRVMSAIKIENRLSRY